MHPSDFAFSILLNFEMDTLEKYVATIEQALDIRQEELRNRIDRLTYGLNDTDVSEVFDRENDDIGFFFGRTPSFAWGSTFILVYSHYEHFIIRLAQRLCKRRAGATKEAILPIHLSSHPDHALRYIEDSGVPIPSLRDEINYYKKIRNQLVHDLGQLDDKGRSKEVDLYIQTRLADGRQGIERVGKLIRLGPDFCRESIATIRQFLDAIVLALPMPQGFILNRSASSDSTNEPF